MKILETLIRKRVFGPRHSRGKCFGNPKLGDTFTVLWRPDVRL